MRELEKLERQLAEIKEYDEKVHHLADRMIEIDLDDGVSQLRQIRGRPGGDKVKLSEVEKQLNSIFSSPPKSGSNRHIVFWYDPDAEFADDIDAIELQEVRLWKLTGKNNYVTKRLLEAGDTQSNFLIYCPGPRPEPRKNWLLDIELYSERFTADRTEAIMRELGG